MIEFKDSELTGIIHERVCPRERKRDRIPSVDLVRFAKSGTGLREWTVPPAVRSFVALEIVLTALGLEYYYFPASALGCFWLLFFYIPCDT